jgi:hypothetical protein
MFIVVCFFRSWGFKKLERKKKVFSVAALPAVIARSFKLLRISKSSTQIFVLTLSHLSFLQTVEEMNPTRRKNFSILNQKSKKKSNRQTNEGPVCSCGKLETLKGEQNTSREYIREECGPKSDSVP